MEKSNSSYVNLVHQGGHMADFELKEGQIYLLDGNTLVEAAFNDNTGLWQLHESEERSSWLVSPNGKLLGMQFDMGRDVWLLDREPDIWTVNDLQTAGEKSPKLARLLRQVETTAQQKHSGQLTLLRVDAGWKAIYGSLNLDTEEGRRELQKAKTFKSLYEALAELVAAV
jgi:hypothetical protein